MWVALPTGFYSTVARFGGEDAGVNVRVRVKTDLETLIECYLPESGLQEQIQTRPGRDYEFAVLMSHEQWATCMWYASWDVTYHNFKDEVTKTQGKKRHDVYLKVWTVLRNGLEGISHRPPPNQQQLQWDSSDQLLIREGKRGSKRGYHREEDVPCTNFEAKQPGSVYCTCGFSLSSHLEL